MKRLFLVALALGLSGCGSSHHVRVTGGTPDQRRLVARIVRGLAPVAIDRVAIAPARIGFTAPRGAVELTIPTRRRLHDVRGEWEAELVAAAFAAAEPRIRRVYVATGSSTSVAGVRAPRPVSVAAVERAAAHARAEAGATVRELRVVRSLAPGVAMTVRTSHPAAYLLHGARRPLEILRHARVDILYFAVEDSSGRIVLAWGVTPNTGTYHVDRRLEGCSPIAPLSVPIGYKTPECPAH